MTPDQATTAASELHTIYWMICLQNGLLVGWFISWVTRGRR
jgi:hypothetical protein